jgi:hypothetical protein
MRLPDFSLQVKGFFVAVPQIEHNWTPHRPLPPQTLNDLGATNMRAFDDEQDEP